MWSRARALLVAVLLGTSGCLGSTAGPSSPPAVLLALDARGTLSALAMPSGDLLARTHLGGGGPLPYAAGDYLLRAGRQRVVALAPPRRGGAAQTLAELALPQLTLVRSVPLPRRIVYRAIAGPDGGLVYAVGNLLGRARTELGVHVAGVVVTRVDLTTGRERTWMVRPAGALDWTVLDALWVARTQRLFVTYHGGQTTGADWIDLTGGRFRVCPGGRIVQLTGLGCLAAVHGALAVSGRYLVAADGNAHRLVLYSLLGRFLRMLPSDLHRSHLMVVGVDPYHPSLAYAIGFCGMVGGLDRVPVAGGAPALVGPRSVCGSRLAFGPDGTIAVAQNPTPSVTAGRARLTIATLHPWRIRRSIRTPGFLLDLLAVGRPG